MKVKAKVNIILGGIRYSSGEVFEINKDTYERVKPLVDVVEDTIPKKEIKKDDIVIPEEGLKEKVITKGRKKKKKE